jgi:hypothetical protein
MMTKINYRTALPEDITGMVDLFLVALKNLYSRNKICAAVPPRPAVLKGYEHIRSTRIIEVAEQDGRIEQYISSG